MMPAPAAGGVPSGSHAREESPEALARMVLACGGPMGIVLDHDGTLVRFRIDPAEALPSARALRALARLVGARRPVCMISGRPLGFLRRAFPVPGIDLIGSHGAEFSIGRTRRPSSTRPDPAVARLSGRLQESLRDAPRGMVLERKPFGVAVHLRALPAGSRASWMRRATEIVERALPEGFETLTGSCVVEARRSGAGKGRALERLRGSGERWRRGIVVAGDDRTDEDMFEALVRGDVGILVARSTRPSAAAYRLRSPADMLRFLESLTDLEVR